MKFCEECGAKLEDDALFCEECGTRVENDEPDTNGGFETIGEDFKFCEECGAKNEISAMFCEECGTKFESETAVIEPEPEVESQIEEPESEPIVEELEPEVIIEAVEPEPEVKPETEPQIEEPESEPIVEELEPEVIIEAVEPELEPEPEAEPQIEESESEPIVEAPEPEVIIEVAEPEPEVEPQIEEPEIESIVEAPGPEVIIEAVEPEPEPEPEAESQIEEPESEPIVEAPEPEVIIEVAEPEPEAEPQIEEPESEPILEEPEPEVVTEATEPEPEPEPVIVKAENPAIQVNKAVPEANKSVKKSKRFIIPLVALVLLALGGVAAYFMFGRGMFNGAPNNQTIIATPIPSEVPIEAPTVTPTETPTEAPIETQAIVIPTLTNTMMPMVTNTSTPTSTNTPVPTATATPTSTNTPVPTATATASPAPTAIIAQSCNGKHSNIIVKSKFDTELEDSYKVMIGCQKCDELDNIIYVPKDLTGKWYYYTETGILKNESVTANHTGEGFIVRYTSDMTSPTCKSAGEIRERIEIINNGDFSGYNVSNGFIVERYELDYPLSHDYRCSDYFFIEGTSRTKLYVVLKCTECGNMAEGVIDCYSNKEYVVEDGLLTVRDSFSVSNEQRYPYYAAAEHNGNMLFKFETGYYGMILFEENPDKIPERHLPDSTRVTLTNQDLNPEITTIPVVKASDEKWQLSQAVNTLSAYDYSYSAQFDASGKNQFPGSRFVDRTPVYFYHPIKIVYSDKNVEPAIWVSSDNEVARVYSDGVVEAFSEGIADISAYDINGKLIGTLKIFTTTKADSDPIGSYIDYSDRKQLIEAYKDIPFQDIQDNINCITDLVAYMYAYEMRYITEEEGSSPFQHRSSYGDDWTQTIGSDWLFKNRAGICHNASAAALYSLVGDYERNGIIQMSGDFGHTISWFYENGKYYVYDFTGVYDSVSAINTRYQNNIYAFVMDNIGIGDTLYDALTDCAKNSGTDFYFKNFVLYSVELTGKDYYPAESNSWLHDSRNITGKTNKLYFTKGTNVELLYLQDGIKLEMVFIDRDDAGPSMRAYVAPTDTDDIVMDTNYGRLRSVTDDVLPSYYSQGAASLNENLKMPQEIKIVNTYTANKLLASPQTASSETGSFLGELLAAGNLSDYLLMDYSDTYQFVLKDNQKADYYISSDNNVLRVRSDGVMKAYAEGIATVYACDKAGNIVAKQSYVVTTAADANPLAATRTLYNNINLEDIPEKLQTITDYACWLYDNHVVADGNREPKGPNAILQDAANRAIWFPIANSEWTFLDRSGVCCNFSAGASYALCNDYEVTGQIMMCGPYGHVINYYYENGQYYVIDYTKVVEDYDLITVLYHGNAALYVSERIGIGDSIKEAYKDYTSKNERRFYEENPFMYTLNTSGYNFYNTECNNWSSTGVRKDRVNTLYSSTCGLNELFIIKEGYAFEIVPLYRDEIPGSMQTFYNKNEAPSWRYETYFSFCDNPSNLSGILDGGNANSGGAAVNPNGGMDGSGLEIVIEENVTGTLVYDGMWFACYDNKYLSFWGMAGDGIILPERLIIPEEINGLPVKIIGEWSITKTEKLKEIYFPRSIERVGNMNFIFGDYRKFVAYVYEGSFMEEYCKKYNFNYVLR